jgi:hypothetical protein
MHQADAITEFVTKYGEKLRKYFSRGHEAEDSSASDLKDFMGSVAAIANDPDGHASIEAVCYQDDNNNIKAAIQFSTKQAREARKNIESHRRILQSSSHAPHSRVLMTFVRLVAVSSG